MLASHPEVLRLADVCRRYRNSPEHTKTTATPNTKVAHKDNKTGKCERDDSADTSPAFHVEWPKRGHINSAAIFAESGCNGRGGFLYGKVFRYKYCTYNGTYRTSSNNPFSQHLQKKSKKTQQKTSWRDSVSTRRRQLSVTPLNRAPCCVRRNHTYSLNDAIGTAKVSHTSVLNFSPFEQRMLIGTSGILNCCRGGVNCSGMKCYEMDLWTGGLFLVAETCRGSSLLQCNIAEDLRCYRTVRYDLFIDGRKLVLSLRSVL